ncbi:MAG: hypothetical protein HRT71_02200 [Flavobacteriales bacterium]|nr:hypothetical protein [Flavobacteriales bacterium]
MKNALLSSIIIFALTALSIEANAQIPGTSYIHKFTGGDLSSLTHTGSALTVVDDRATISSNAINLNGDHLSRPSFNSPHVTVSFWIKTTTNDGVKRTIIDHTERTSSSDVAGERGWYAYIENGIIGIAGNYFYSYIITASGTYVSGNTGYAYTLGTTNVADGNWHHVLLSAEGTYLGNIKYYYRVYIDGVHENVQMIETLASNNNTTYNLLPTTPFTIGNNNSGNLTNQYEDEIDDIRFYGGLQTSAGILALAHEDACKAPLDITVSNIGPFVADISWSASGVTTDCDFAYSLTGQGIGSATIINTVGLNSYSLSGLNPNTTYDVYLRSHCDGGVTTWSAAIPFTTRSVIFVDESAAGANDGTTWQNAFTDLQSAVALGSSINEIWIAAGTYTPGSVRTSTFSLLTGTTLFGGFNGTETNADQRNPMVNTTFLSGDLLRNDGTTISDTDPTRTDNAYHVITLKGTPQNVVVDGFTITGGNANGALSNNCGPAAASQYYHGRGGAIYINPYAVNHSITALFNNCIIEKNSGTNVAVYSTFTPCGVSYLTTDVDFLNTIIRDNYSKDVSNMFWYGSAGYFIFSRGSMVNCLFYNNTSDAMASCLYLGVSSGNGGGSTGLGVDIVNCTFANNTGANGNVIKMLNAAKSNINNSIIYGNGSITPFDITSSGSVVTNSIVEGGQQSGLDSDPLFNNPSTDDYTLNCASPGIDAGDSTGLFIPMIDLAGENRFGGSALDMGVYELNTLYSAITAITKDITVYLDASGNATITSSDVDNYSGSTCGTAFTLGIDVTTFTCIDLGANTVTLTATETSGGATDIVTSTVTIADNIAPTAIGQNVIVSLDASGNATVLSAAIDNGSNDNCTASGSLGLSLDFSSFTCADLGVNNVMLFVEDGSGNKDTAFVTVTIEDNELPIAVAQNVTVAIDINSGVAIITPTMIDNGSSDNCAFDTTLSVTEFNCANVGNNAVILTVQDSAGNVATATSIVTVTSPINDETVTTSDMLCTKSTPNTTIVTGSSQLGVAYTLRDTANNIIDGPTSGTGSGLTFNTGAISSTSTFNVYAESIPAEFNNGGLSFDGSNDYIATPVPANFQYNSIYTIEAWVKAPLPNSTGGYYPLFFVGNTLVSDVEVYIQKTTNGLVLVHNRGNGGTNSYHTFPVPPDNVWFHFALVYNGSTVEAFYNGVSQGSAAISTPAVSASNMINVGTISSVVFDVGSSTKFFIGEMDDYRMWSTARTASEISSNMSACLNGTETGLEVYYNFEDGTGLTATDVANGNNGTMANMDASISWVAGAYSCSGAVCSIEMSDSVLVTVIDTSTTLGFDTITSNQLGASYIWLDCANSYSEIAGETDIYFVPLVNGNYAVEVTLNGCVDTSACINHIITGLANRTKPNVTISSYGKVITVRGGKGNISIYDLAGRKIRDSKLNGKIDMQISQEGIYLVRVTSKYDVIFKKVFLSSGR